MDRFRYNLHSSAISDDASSEPEFSGILEIYVHHARNIHNICIYDNQDVYAKFSLTYDPDETLSTRIINGGGKNPDFNESLRMKISQRDAVLKCEIWMLSRARSYMEDQLLGFALVPLSQLAGKATKMTQDYSLSSTDLFHSPAGTVQLTLSLNTCLPVSPSLDPLSASPATSSISSEVVLLDRKASEAMVDPVEYSRIEFPDISVVRENQQMVSEYFDLAKPGSGPPGASFLHLGAPADDYEMAANSSEETRSDHRPVSPQNSGFFSSTTTSLSDDRNSGDSINKKSLHVGGESSITGEAGNQSSSISCGPDTPTSKKGSEARAEKAPSFSRNKEDENSKSMSNEGGPAEFGRVFPAPLGSVDMEADQSAMQQQIVDMYMRSMQQFTESLAKMKLPMELDKAESQQDRSGDAIQGRNGSNNKLELEKKDGSRVFYGSRAFF